MKFRIKLVVSFILTTITGSLWADEVILVQDKVAIASIVVPTNSKKRIFDLAIFLQDYVAKSTGVKLKISNRQLSTTSIFLGLYQNNHFGISTKETLDEDGSYYKAVDNYVYILGGSIEGLEFGVYSFLEKHLGVKWLMPSNSWTIIPKVKTLAVPEESFIDNPVYLSRRLAPLNADRKGADNEWAKLNRLKHRVEFNHSLYKIFNEIPEMKQLSDAYPIYNGKTYTPINSQDQRWQPNFSSKKSVELTSNYIIGYFKKNNKEKSYSLSINDSRQFDERSSSKKRRNGKLNYLGLEDVSNDYYQWVNNVVERVNNYYPSKKYGALAYNNTAEAPDFPLNSNVIPFLTNERLQWVDLKYKKQGQQLTIQWNKKASVVGWYDYIYGFNYLLPRLWPNHFKEYLLWGSNNNVKHYVSELYPNWGEGPKAWVTTKLLWNPKLSVDSLTDEWYDAAVGSKAAPYLKGYYDVWEAFWTKKIRDTHWWPDHATTYLPFSDLSYLALVDNEQIVKSDEAFKMAFSVIDDVDDRNRLLTLYEMWGLYKSAILSYNANKRSQIVELRDTDDFKLDSKESFFDYSFMDKFDVLKENELFFNSLGYMERYKHEYLWSINDLSIDQNIGFETRQRQIENRLTNPSFNDNLNKWKLWQSKDSEGSFSMEDREKIFVIDNTLFGTVYQDLRYEKGVYVALIKFRVSGVNNNSALEASMQIFSDKKVGIPNEIKSIPAILPLNREWKVYKIRFNVETQDVKNPGFIRFKVDIKNFLNEKVLFDSIHLYKL